ncbi:MAG: homocysteine S-methyltransferase family protein [Anaerolineae bacterium]|nr:homocysteine S-methyltransferase family protein [Anaerolineae bacterium]
MEDFFSRLTSGRVIVADGAMGTMLQAAGLPTGVSTEAWLLEHPDAVMGVHRAYVEAGAELILTCTFGGNRVRLKRSGLAERVAEVNHRAVELARQAAGARAYVAGDIGPLGELLAPLGKLTYEEAVALFAEQARALVEAGVDVLYIETMADLNEARAAVEGARRADEGVPVTVTLSFDTRGRTNMGVRPEQAVATLLPLGVAAIGANCGHSLEMTLEALEHMHAFAPQVVLIAKPNAGLPRMVGRQEVYDATPEMMADYALKYVAAGARVVGGCCGSTPEHIRAIARALRP